MDGCIHSFSILVLFYSICARALSLIQNGSTRCSPSFSIVLIAFFLSIHFHSRFHFHFFSPCSCIFSCQKQTTVCCLDFAFFRFINWSRVSLPIQRFLKHTQATIFSIFGWGQLNSRAARTVKLPRMTMQNTENTANETKTRYHQLVLNGLVLFDIYAFKCCNDYYSFYLFLQLDKYFWIFFWGGGI